MPKFKKPPKNSYYFYMIERREKMEAEGIRFRGMEHLAKAVAQDWKLLTKEEKKKYEQRAKDHNKAEKHNLNNKFTCSGESYASLMKRMEQEQSELAKQTEYLESLVRCHDPTSRIYIAMHAIPSCAAEIKISAEKEIWPLEFCIAAFSLKHGLISHFWSLIDTVRVPTGYMSEAKDTAAETLLPVPGSEKFKEEARSAATDYVLIFWKIRRFVEQFCQGYSGNYVIFGMEENLHAIRGTIKWLVNSVEGSRQNNQEFLDKITFMRLPNLVLSLSVLAKEMNPDYETELTQLQLVDSAISLLNWSHFDYRKEVTCLYHIMEEHCETMQICCSNYILRRIFIVLQEIGILGFLVESTERHALETFRNPTQCLPGELSDKLNTIDQPPPKVQKLDSTEEETAKKEEAMYSTSRKKFKRRSDEANSAIDDWVGVNKKPRLGPSGNAVTDASMNIALPGHNSVFNEVSLGCSVPTDIITIEDDEEAPEKYKLEDFPEVCNEVGSQGRGVRRITREDEFENRFPGEVADIDSRGRGRRPYQNDFVREPQRNTWDDGGQDCRGGRGRGRPSFGEGAGRGRHQQDIEHQYDGRPLYQQQESNWGPRNSNNSERYYGYQDRPVFETGYQRSSSDGYNTENRPPYDQGNRRQRNNPASSGNPNSTGRGNWRGGGNGNQRYFSGN